MSGIVGRAIAYLGLGSLAGKVWRIGLMGYNSTPENVEKVLNVFESELPRFKEKKVAVAA